eukprot:1148903-Pelagomonas_calceolata.AAC.1
MASSACKTLSEFQMQAHWGLGLHCNSLVSSNGLIPYVLQKHQAHKNVAMPGLFWGTGNNLAKILILLKYLQPLCKQKMPEPSAKPPFQCTLKLYYTSIIGPSGNTEAKGLGGRECHTSVKKSMT